MLRVRGANGFTGGDGAVANSVAALIWRNAEQVSD
jgi:hypothetical protein